MFVIKPIVLYQSGLEMFPSAFSIAKPENQREVVHQSQIHVTEILCITQLRKGTINTFC